MRTKIPLLGFALLAFTSGCNKKEPNTRKPEPDPNATYPMLKPGNYWIYNEYRVNDTSETDEDVTDSVYVEKDTMINNLRYYKLVKPTHWQEPFEWVNCLRDSAGHIVSHTGRIWFSETDFTNVFHTSYLRQGADTIAKVTTKMSDKDFTVSTPAGIFLTTSLTRSYAMFPKYDPFGRMIIYNTRYAKGTGMVTETLAIFSFNPSERWERRLVRWYAR